MRLPSTANSINKIANVGSTENIVRKLFLYKQSYCKIISIEKATAGNNGKIFLIGNADSTNNGLLEDGDTLILTSRPMDSTHEFTISVQPSYSSTDKVTTVTVPTTANFEIDYLDIGAFVCKKIDVTDRVKKGSFGQISTNLEDGFANSGSSELKVTLDNTDSYFFDRQNNSGIFYNNTHLTNVKTIGSTSNYSDEYGIYTTEIELDDISGDVSATDYIGQHILFNSGKAIGHQALIVRQVSGNNFESVGYLSENYFDPIEYHTEIQVGDGVYLSISDIYWFRYEFGILSEPTERVNLICGKIDNFSFNNFDKLVEITGYTYEKDFDDKNIGDINFSRSSIKGTKLDELNLVYYEPGIIISKSIKEIVRSSITNGAEFMNVDAVSYDIDPGWHIIDVIPQTGLFRFNFGQWTKIRDSGDFEYATNSVFLAAHYGTIPDHSSVDGSDEKKMHKGWAQVSIETQNNASIGVSNTSYTGATSSKFYDFEKITGLPNKPTRFFFKISEGAGINKLQEFIGKLGYQFDGGEIIHPEILPATVLTGDDLTDLTDETSKILYGDHWDQVGVVGTETDYYLIIGAFNKFNGLYLNCTFLNSGGIITKLFSHLSLKFSIGGDISDSDNWSKNIYPRYCGATVDSVTGDYSQTFIKMAIVNWDSPSTTLGGAGGAGSLESFELNNMYLKSVSGDNFGEVREITDFTKTTTYGEFTISSAFSNTLAVGDQFEVVNKNIEIKVRDFGDSLHCSEYADCCFASSIFGGISGTDLRYYDLTSTVYQNYEADATITNVEKQAEIYIGKYKKYSNLNFEFEMISKATDYFGDLPNLKIEYWDGSQWSPVEDLAVFDVDTTDTDFLGSNKEDKLHFICSFEALNWVKRNASSFTFGTTVKNKDVDLYYIRIKTDMAYMRKFVRADIIEPSNLHACIIWNDFKEWAQGSYFDENSLNYGTLTTNVASIPNYFVQLRLVGYYRTINRIQLINKLVGHSNDSIYMYFDLLNLDYNEDKDFISINENNKTNSNFIPKICTDKYLMDNIGNSINISNRMVNVENYIKNKIDYNKRNLNLIGNFKGAVKLIPAELNWDAAQYFNSNDYDVTPSGSPTNILCSCIIKDRGEFRLFLLRTITGTDTVEMYTSDDGKTSWSKDGSTLTPTGNYSDGITWLSVVKNQDSDTFHMFLVGEKSGNSDKVFHVSWTSWGTFTQENSGNAVLDVGSGGSWDDTDIIDCCVTWNGNDFWEMYYTADSGTEYAIGRAYDTTSGGNTWSKDANNPLIQKGSGGSWDETSIQSPAVMRSEIVNSYNNNFVFVYYIGEDSSNNKKIGLAIIGYAAGSSNRASWKYDNNPVFDTAISLVSLCYCYDGDGRFQIPFSYDFVKFYYSTSSTVEEIFTIDGITFNRDKLSYDYVDEFGEFDHFVSDQTSLDFTSSSGECLIVGFRKKFNTVDLTDANTTSEKLSIEYWDGSDWQDLQVIQYNAKSNLVKNNGGFYFDEPKDWQPINIGHLVDNQKISGTDDYLRRDTPSLYFIKISTSETGAIQLKRVRLCKLVYVIATEQDVWILRDDGFLEHKLCATRLFGKTIDNTKWNLRYRIIDISFNSVNNNVDVIVASPESHAYTFSGVSKYGKFFKYVINIFSNVGSIPKLGDIRGFKGNKHAYRLGKDFTNSQSKRMMLIGRHSDDYVDGLGA